MPRRFEGSASTKKQDALTSCAVAVLVALGREEIDGTFKQLCRTIEEYDHVEVQFEYERTDLLWYATATMTKRQNSIEDIVTLFQDIALTHGSTLNQLQYILGRIYPDSPAPQSVTEAKKLFSRTWVNIHDFKFAEENNTVVRKFKNRGEFLRDIYADDSRIFPGKKAKQTAIKALLKTL